MSITVAKFIAWLQTQDQEAIVEVVNHTSGRGWGDQGGNAEILEFDPENQDLFEYTDMRDNQFVTPDKSYYNRRFLLLGQHNG